MRYLLFLCFALVVFSCKKDDKKAEIEIEPSTDISAISAKPFRDFKVLDSKVILNESIWKVLEEQLKDFSEEKYTALKSLILDQDIPTLQKHIVDGKLSYELLTKFYLYRIKMFDRETDLSLNSVISLNPNAIEDAKAKDREFLNKKMKHPVFGMPILLKDNINANQMPTTVGALALLKNSTEDAYITRRLKSSGAIILGKANLSEWAYFFCGDCPSGYSAVGGQTLNPYGRKIIDTGGSSSGSGVAVTADFCAAAVGSETAGSILSPASQNSVVGLKPTIGLLSRSGIVPISSTLDTPGPITKNVIDNAIVLDAMKGFDKNDFKSIKSGSTQFFNGLSDANLNGKRFGVFKELMKDSLYLNAIDVLRKQGAIIVEISEEKIELPDFIRLLNLDMKADLATYFRTSASKSLQYDSIEDIMEFNTKKSDIAMPYGQSLFEGVSKDKSTKEEFDVIKATLKTNGRQFFDIPMKSQNLVGILSINNYHAGEAAVAEYPAITIPMGYTNKGVPEGLTLISKPLSEYSLLQWAYAYEQASRMRVAPRNYN
ncbi:amidase family protein [Psychroserpens ponticola]|uniref:Amidase family protein n=1 Tax=Psychroserpens ponticola TaxID=2932268 RepID=A0ABY7RUZ3_9FLAO|nr:amidase family protein [Psychroserpens ponticola]WCO00937.1 amidase family protein [Psychroserpens ponticola]